MAKIPVTDNDFRLLTVWDVQEINTTIYSAELRSDFDEQSVYYGVLDSILKKSALLTDPDIIPLISQFIGYGDRIGNVPQQYTTLINFRNTNFEEQQNNENGDNGFGDEEEDVLPGDNGYGTVDYYYYPITDADTANEVVRTMRLPIPISSDKFFFIKDEGDVTNYFKAYPPYELDNNLNRKIPKEITLVECAISDNIIYRLPDLYVSDGWSDIGVVKLYEVDVIYLPRIVITDILSYPLIEKNAPIKRPIRRRIGTGRG